MNSGDLASFETWWRPYSHDPITGASIGGQPDAFRYWARPKEDSFGWERRQYGEMADRAFKSAVYYAEWKEWKLAGEPIGQWMNFLGIDDNRKFIFALHNEPFVSHCLPLEEQAARLGEVHKIVGNKRYIA